MQLIVCKDKNNRVSYAVADDVLIDFSKPNIIMLNNIDKGAYRNMHICTISIGKVEVVIIPDEDMPAEWIGNKYRWNGSVMVSNAKKKIPDGEGGEKYDPADVHGYVEETRDKTVDHTVKKFLYGT